MEIALNRDVDAPAERVWQIITDLEGSERVVSGIDDVQILAGEDGHRGDGGDRARARLLVRRGGGEHGVRYLSGAEPQGTMARVMAATMGRLFVGADQEGASPGSRRHRRRRRSRLSGLQHRTGACDRRARLQPA